MPLIIIGIIGSYYLMILLLEIIVTVFWMWLFKTLLGRMVIKPYHILKQKFQAYSLKRSIRAGQTVKW